jgi:hypothetical protein
LASDVEIRAPTAVELAAIYGNAEHYVGAADGQVLGWISFRRVDDRVWGLFGMVSEATAHQKRRMFYAFRKLFQDKPYPVYFAAQDKAAERVLRLGGLRPTGQSYAGKDVWIWIPERCSCSELA